jgi:Skp family chaperone for outer membrane proteins
MKSKSSKHIASTAPFSRIFFETRGVFLIIRVFKAHKSRSKMNTTVGMTFKKGINKKDKYDMKIRREMRALKKKLKYTKLELAQKKARAEAEKRKLEFEIKVLNRCYEHEIARADAECIARAVGCAMRGPLSCTDNRCP